MRVARVSFAVTGERVRLERPLSRVLGVKIQKSIGGERRDPLFASLNVSRLSKIVRQTADVGRNWNPLAGMARDI